MNPDTDHIGEVNEIEVVAWVPNGVETPQGWSEANNRPSHHSLWSRLVVKEDEH